MTLNDELYDIFNKDYFLNVYLLFILIHNFLIVQRLGAHTMWILRDIK